jgi:hypothetical protein
MIISQDYRTPHKHFVHYNLVEEGKLGGFNVCPSIIGQFFGK